MNSRLASVLCRALIVLILPLPAGAAPAVQRTPIVTGQGYFPVAIRLQDGRIAPCLVEVYAVKVEKVARKFKEHGQRERRWVSFTEAQNLVEEPELRGLIMQLAARLGDERQGG